MPFFPPIELSTCASKVVGIKTNLIPLKTVLATKPDKSPTVPPPIAIKVEERSTLNFNNFDINFE